MPDWLAGSSSKAAIDRELINKNDKYIYFTGKQCPMVFSGIEESTKM